MKPTISVRYFAILRDIAGKSSDELAFEAGQTAGQIYGMLSERYGFPLNLSEIRVAINDDFAHAQQPLAAGDKLVFIPPVSGG